MWTRGSKSNAMTAIGTVAAVYKRAKCRLADSPRVTYPVLGRCRGRHHQRHRADVRGGAAGRSGGKIEGSGGLPMESRRPAPGGTGRTS